MTALTEPSLQSLIARYGLEARFELIPWEELPTDLRQACDELLATWWASPDPDQPIQASGLIDMTVAQLLAVCHAQREGGLPLPGASGSLHRRFRVVSYLRVEPEASGSISLTEALSELDQLQLLEPESIRRIEEVCQVIVASGDPPPSQE